MQDTRTSLTTHGSIQIYNRMFIYNEAQNNHIHISDVTNNHIHIRDVINNHTQIPNVINILLIDQKIRHQNLCQTHFNKNNNNTPFDHLRFNSVLPPIY